MCAIKCDGNNMLQQDKLEMWVMWSWNSGCYGFWQGFIKRGKQADLYASDFLRLADSRILNSEIWVLFLTLYIWNSIRKVICDSGRWHKWNESMLFWPMHNSFGFFLLNVCGISCNVMAFLCINLRILTNSCSCKSVSPINWRILTSCPCKPVSPIVVSGQKLYQYGHQQVMQIMFGLLVHTSTMLVALNPLRYCKRILVIISIGYLLTSLKPKFAS